MQEIIKIENLNLKFENTQALNNVNLSINEGDYCAIIGPNGGGKTTLLRCILGLLKPSSGRVLLFGEPPAKTRQQVGFVPQFAKLNKRFPMTVLEAVLCGTKVNSVNPFFKYKKIDRQKAMEKLENLKIENLYKRSLDQLSGGEFQRLLIARALMSDPKLLLLDEPTSSIDPRSRELIYQLLSDLNKTSSIIMVSHDLIAISQNVKSIICLNKNLIYHGEPSLTEDTVNSLYGCPIDLIAHGVPHRVLAKHSTEGGCCH